MRYSSTLLKSAVEIIVLHAAFCLYDAVRRLLPYAAQQGPISSQSYRITCYLYHMTPSHLPTFRLLGYSTADLLFALHLVKSPAC